MIRERIQCSPPQSIVCEMKALRIPRHLCHGALHLIEEPITQLAAALCIVKRQRDPKIPLDLLVINDPHRSPSKIPADLLPTAPDCGIHRQFARTAAGLCNPVVTVHQHRRKLSQQLRCQARPLAIRQFHRPALNLLKLHARSLVPATAPFNPQSGHAPGRSRMVPKEIRKIFIQLCHKIIRTG